LPARNRDSARPGLDLGGRERRIVKIPAIQFLPVAIADRHRPRHQPVGGSIVTPSLAAMATSLPISGMSLVVAAASLVRRTPDPEPLLEARQ
jgi:hypothetical protein